MVPTPPEIAAAHGITDERCRPPDALQRDDLATCFPPVAGTASEGIASMIYTSCTTGNPKGVRRLDIGADPAQPRTVPMNKVFGIAPDRVVRAVITGPRGRSSKNIMERLRRAPSSSTAPRKRSRSPALSGGHCPVARSGSTMPMAEPCPWVRWVRFTFGSRAFPISPITAWTTSAVLVEMADIVE